MADIDSLSIQISASSSQATKAINDLIRKLGELNNSLNNYSDSSKYVKGLTNLSNGLNGIADAVARIDTAKIKDVSSVLKSLSGAGDKLSKLTFAKSLTEMGAEAQKASNEVKKTAKEIATLFEFDKDKQGVEELTSALQKLFSATDNTAKGDALKGVENVISGFSNAGKEIDETRVKLGEFIRSLDIKLPENIVSELGEDFKYLRGYMGISNTSYKKGAMTEGDFADALRNAGFTQFEGIENEVELFRKVAEYLRDTSAEMVNENAVAETLADTMERLAESVGYVKEQTESLDFSWMDKVGGDDIVFGDPAQVESISRGAEQAQEAVSGLNEQVQQMEQTFSQIQNPFDGLVTGLESLQGINISAEQFAGVSVVAASLGKLGGSYSANAAQSLPYIADGLERLSQVNVNPTLGAELTELGAGIAKLGTKAVERAQGLSFVAQGLRELSTVGSIPQIKGLQELATSLSLFGRKTATEAIANIPQLATAFRSLIDTLSSAPNVSRNTIDLANAIGSMASAGGKAGASITALTGRLNSYGGSASRAGKKTLSLASMFGKLYASYFLVLRAFRGIGSAITYASDLTEVQNVVDTVFGDAKEKVQDFADTAMMSFGMSELSAKQFASNFQSMGVAMGITSEQIASASDFIGEKLAGQERAYTDLGDSMADMSINLTKLTADMASFYNLDYSDVQEDLQSVFTGQTRPLRQYGLDLTNATLKEYALKNGLDADIESMTQAEKTMLRYQYVMSQMGHVMGDFEKTADTYANVVRTIGQQVQKLGQLIGTGLINAFKPALIAFRDFMNTLIGLTEKALNAIGKLLGWQIEIEEVGTTMDDGMSDYADDVGAAADNAKKLKMQLRGIDELNNLTTSNSGDGSGGGSGASGAGGGAGVVSGGGLTIVPYESDISSWFELGRKISNALASAMESIDWDSIYGKAKDFGTNLAEFLNGLITPRLFYDLGMTIAKALNTAIYSAVAFGENLDWTQMGTSIASSINGFFEHFDFVALAHGINTWAKGILDMMITAVGKVKWDLVGRKIGEFLAKIDFIKILGKVGQLIWKSINAVIDAYAATFKAAPFETALLTLVGLTKLLKVNAIKNFATAIKSAYGVVNTFTNTVIATHSPLTALGTVFPKLGTAIGAVQSAFLQFHLGMKSGVGVAESLNGAFLSLGANMSPVAKGITGLVAGLADFLLSKDAVHDMVTDTGSLVGNIGELILAVGGAGAAFSMVFGFPAGVAIAAVIAMIGAVAGLVSGVKELEEQRFGESIRRAFTNEGGVPLDELIQGTRNNILSIGTGFEEVSQKSAELEQARGNVSSLVQEIALLKQKLDDGKLSGEDLAIAMETLSQKINDLAAAIQTKLQVAFDTALVGMRDYGSILSDVGVDMDTMKDKTYESFTSSVERAEQLTTALQHVPYGTQTWNNIYDELISLSTEVSDADQAVIDLQRDVNEKGLDWSGYIDKETGKLEVDSVVEVLNSFWSAASEVSDKTRDGLHGVADAMKGIGAEENKSIIENAIPDALAVMNQRSGTEIKTATDALQYDLIDKLSAEVEAAKADWDELDWYEQLLYPAGMGDYIKQRVEAYKTEFVDPLSDEIETNMAQLGLEGEGWASDAAQEIIDGLFTLTPAMVNGTRLMVPELRDNWQEVIDQAVDGVDTQSAGEQIVAGVAEGMESADYEAPAKGFLARLWDNLLGVLGIHSPATTMKPVGKNIVLGIFEGFSLVDFGKKMSDWWDSEIKPWFNLERWKELGENAKKGLTDKWNELKTKTDELWGNIKNSISTKLTDAKTDATNLAINIKTTLETWWTNAHTVTEQKFKGIQQKIYDKLEEARTNAETKGSAIKGVLETWWTNAFNATSTKFESLRQKIYDKLEEARGNVDNRASVLKTTLDHWWGQAESGTDGAFSRIAGTINSWMSNARDTVSTLASNIMSIVSGISFGGLISSAQSAAAQVASIIGGAEKGIQDASNAAANSNKAPATQDKAQAESSKNLDSASTTLESSAQSLAQAALDLQKSVNDSHRDKIGDLLGISQYAGGGFPRVGSLFIAGEAGAEILGTVGGKTAVAGGAEITGIRDAINQASATETALLRALISAVESGGTITIDGKSLARSIRQADREYYNRTGVGMFAH